MIIIDYRNDYLKDNKATATTLALGKKCTRYNVIKYYHNYFLKYGYRVINTLKKPHPPLILSGNDGRLVAVEIEKTKEAINRRLEIVKDVYQEARFSALIILHYSLDKTILTKLKGGQIDVILKKIEQKKRYLKQINSYRIK